jgi:hypothetical protein
MSGSLIAQPVSGFAGPEMRQRVAADLSLVAPDDVRVEANLREF